MTMERIDPHYTAALDEIYRLRVILAHEAQIQEGHLAFASFPKSRRKVAERSIERMREAARGHSKTATVAIPLWKQALKSAGASETFTRADWEGWA